MIFIGYDYPNDEVEWKKIYINGKETKYSISNIGLVRNDDKDKILKTSTHKGYLRVGLTYNGKQKSYLVHRLVALAFIPNTENKPEVNHKNGNKKCNYTYNLEWVTHSENERHAYDTGLNTGKHTRKYTKTEKKIVKKICKLLEQNELTLVQIANKVGVSRSVVSSIQKRQTFPKISDQFNIGAYKIKTDFSKHGDDSERTIYSDEKIHDVCKLIDSGKYDLQTISSMTGVHYQTVRNVYYGTCRRSVSSQYKFMDTKKNPLYENRKAEILKICEMLDDGMTPNEISKKLGVSASSIRKIRRGEQWGDVSKDFKFRKTYIIKKKKKYATSI